MEEQQLYIKSQYIQNIKEQTLNPAGSSQYCPRCGSKGHHVIASDNLKKKKSGGWFVCPHCNFNADRDYVATCNLARKVLYGNSLKNQSKAVVYRKTAIPDLPVAVRSEASYGYSYPTATKWQERVPIRQGALRLRRCLRGWKKSAFIRHPFFSGTLRN